MEHRIHESPDGTACVAEAAPATAPAAPDLSVIIAARNAALTLPRCLDALCAQAGAGTEIIVVDDASTDRTSEVAGRYPVRLHRLGRHLGVAAARNRGADLARAPLLLFLDADAVPMGTALARGRELMRDPGLDAVFGSYDDEPEAPTLVSRWKNLAHHYFHHRSEGPATTFWSACGLVRREAFAAVGGFDEERFLVPSIEDVDLGDRLHERGYRISLAPDLQVKHLKRWTLASLVHTDVALRAVPWTRMGLSRGRLPRNLNFAPGQGAAAVTAVGLTLSLALAPWVPEARLAAVPLFLLACGINRGLFAFLHRKGGLRLAAGGFLLQQLYYLYALCGVAVGIALHVLRRERVPLAGSVTGRP